MIQAAAKAVPAAPPNAGALSAVPAPTGSPSARGLPTWSRPMELALAFLLGCGVMWLSHLAWQRAFGPARPAELLSPVALDLNLAEEGELSQLPGLGPQRARRIVEHRERFGKFQKVDELDQVEGMGSYLVEKLRPAVRVGGERTTLPPPSPGQTDSSQAVLIDLNQASLEDLQRLPGIGPVLAERIANYRVARGPFTRVEDLGRIHGIKAKTIEKVRPYVRVVPPPAERASQPAS